MAERRNDGSKNDNGADEPVCCVLVRGDDPGLVAQAGAAEVRALVGDLDPGEVVEEYGWPVDGDIDFHKVLDAIFTPPMLTLRRVVVIREAGKLGKDDVQALVRWIEDPVEGVALVLLGGGGVLPSPLVRALEAKGRVVSAGPGRGRERAGWIEQRLARAALRLDARALRLVEDHLGDDLARLDGILEALASAYGAGASLGEEAVAPFLGSSGSVPPWELTDAIDGGDVEASLDRLRRLTGEGGMHPLAVLAVLYRHYRPILRLDGEEVMTREEAAALVGTRSPFVAGKALEQAARLGHAGVARAIGILADLDLDLRGASGLDGLLLLEVAVARLARLARSSTRHPTRKETGHKAGRRAQAGSAGRAT